MKKIATLLLALCLFICIPATTAFAAAAPCPTVTVTIADDKGKLVLKQEQVQLTDTDNDGKLTLNDVLYATHEKCYTGGAAAGYKSENGAYGLMLTKLWGVENGGSYGYYLNNKAASSLADEVKDGDCITAFVYTDLKNYSDTYCFFDVNTVSCKTGEDVTLTLMAAGFDENWQPITVPVKGASILLDGEKTDFVTDENGKVTFSVDKAGSYTVSAKSATATLVPPLCVMNAAKDNTVAIIVAASVAAATILVCAGIVIVRKQKKKG